MNLIPQHYTISQQRYCTSNNFSVVTGNNALAITGASIVGTSKIAEESIEYLTSKYKNL